MSANRRWKRSVCTIALLDICGGAHAATFTVTSPADQGPGSLRQAILDANATSAADEIVFAIPGDGPHTIAVQARLPRITSPLLIDGYTQPGAVPNTAPVGTNADLRIELTGALLPLDPTDPSSHIGLELNANDSTIRGLVINQFLGMVLFGSVDGLFSADRGAVEGCFLGTDATGLQDATSLNFSTGAAAFAGTGIRIGGTLPAQRNLISANSTGILATTSSSGATVTDLGLIQGNLIGLAANGIDPLPNSENGVNIHGSAENWLVGGDFDSAANHIAFNGGVGIEIGATNTIGTQIIGNAVHDNVGLGIDYGPNSTEPGGVTPNQLDGELNFPVLDLVEVHGGGTRFTGTLDRPTGTDPLTYTIAVYANSFGDPSGHGEGELFLGATEITLNNGDDESLDLVVPGFAPVGSQVTATASRRGGLGTSELSACLAATVVEDNTPDPFTLRDLAGVPLQTRMISRAIAVSGINIPAGISVTNGAYSIDDGPFTKTPGVVANGQQVRVMHVSAVTFSTSITTTLTIGGVSDTFTSTTEAEDTTPAAFAFVDQIGVPKDTKVTSDPITVTGINAPAPISVLGGEYSIGSGPFVESSGSVMNGDSVRVRHLSAQAFGTNTETQLTIGSVSDTFTSTTVSAGVDLVITKDDGRDLIVSGDATQYLIVVSNIGTEDAIGAAVSDLLSPDLVDATWTCSPTAGADCTDTGSGDLVERDRRAGG